MYGFTGKIYTPAPQNPWANRYLLAVGSRFLVYTVLLVKRVLSVAYAVLLKKPDVLPVTLRMARRSTPGPYPDPADPPVHWPASPVATWLGTPSPPDPGIPTDAAHQMCLSPPRACHHLPPSLRELAVFAYKLTPHSQSCRRPPEIARRHVPSRLQARSSVKLFSNPTIKAYAY